MELRRKEYVWVNVDHSPDGTAIPRSITFEDKRTFEIDRVLAVRRAASTKVGGTGISYTIRVLGKETFLFDEENGRWFVERK